MRCDKSKISFFCKGRLGNIRVVAYINGKEASWYYCAESFVVGFNRSHYADIFSSIDKNINKITIKKSMSNQQTIQIAFDNVKYSTRKIYDVPITRFDDDPELFAIETVIDPKTLNTTFPLEFVLESKSLKKTIKDAEGYSETISFEKHPNYPLDATYTLPNIAYHELYDDSDKIRLITHYDPLNIFKCPIRIGNIESITDSIVTDYVKILCSEEGQILFKSSIDETGLDDNSLIIVYTLATTI